MRGRFRILVVDDDDNMLKSISSMLRTDSEDEYAIDTDTATNNQQALNRFKQIPYDLVSLDMNMPDFDGKPNEGAGINLLEKLRQIDPTLPAIILTGEDEKTIRAIIRARNLEDDVDVFLKTKRGDRYELCKKVYALLEESKVSLLAAGKTKPVSFKRKDIVKIQGVVSKVENDKEGHVFITDLQQTEWLAIAGYGKLRLSEPVDIIGVQDNKFVVSGSSNVVFLHDFYRNKILVHNEDLKGLVGEVVDVNEKMKRNGVRITSSNAPEYLTSKKSWQAVTDDNTLLPMDTEIDILGESKGKLRIRPRQTVILNEQRQEIEITKANVKGLFGKVVGPIDEDEKGSILIISEKVPEILTGERWQAASGDEMIFIPGERVEVLGVKDKKLLVCEFMEEE